MQKLQTSVHNATKLNKLVDDKLNYVAENTIYTSVCVPFLPLLVLLDHYD